MADYFFSLQGRYTYSESVYFSTLGLEYETFKLSKDYPCCLFKDDKGRLLKATVLYGDPAWEARMKSVAPTPYRQSLDVTRVPFSSRYRITFKITMNSDSSVTRHPIALLPFRIRNGVVTHSDVKDAVVADNFILMHVQDDGDPPLKKGMQRTVEIIAEKQAAE